MRFRFTQDNVRGLGQIASRKMRFLAELLRVTAINEDCAAPGRMAAVYVPPPVAHHPALRQVNPQRLRRPQQHAGFGLAAIAFGRALACMIADLHAVNRQPPAHFRMNRFHGFLTQRAAAHVRLVGHHHQQKTCCLEPGASGRHLGKNLKFSQVPGRIRLPVALQGAVDDAVAIEKNGAG